MTTANSSRFSEFRKRVVLVFVSIVVGLVFLEIVVRIIEPREVMRYFFVTSDQIVSHKFIPKARGRYKTTEFDVEYVIDSLGLRDRELSLVKPAHTRRLLMLGDSFTEGDGVRGSETFSSKLQEKIDSAAGEGRWQIINAGVGSYSPLLEYLYLMNGGLKLNPDLVILNFDLSDVYDDIHYTQSARFDAQGTPIAVRTDPEEPKVSGFEGTLIGIKDFFKENTRLYNFIRLRIDRYLEGARHEGNFSGDIHYDKYAMLRNNYQPGDDRDWALSYKYILMIRDTLKARGIDFRLTVYPYGLQISPREWNSGRQFWGFRPDTVYSTRPQKFMEEFCKRNGIPVINMCEDFRELSRSVYPLYRDYNGHWGPEGHELVAQLLFRWLQPRLIKWNVAIAGTGTGTSHPSPLHPTKAGSL